MIRFVRSIWIWSASAMLVILWLPLLGLIWLFDDKKKLLRTGHWFCRLGRLVGMVTPWRIHISGTENLDRNQVYVIVSNHQSLADIPLIAHLPVDMKWLAKAELFRVPLFGWMMRMAGNIPVERAAPQQSARALLQCGKYLRQRCTVVFFPEGGRSTNEQVKEFHDGAFRLAIRERTPILPLVVHGTSHALPRATWMFSENQDVWLRVLPPVSVEGHDVKQSAALRDTVRQQIMDELDQLRVLDRAARG